MATLGSAWCGYQASQWNNEETRLAQQSANARVEASRLFTLAAQTFAYDSTTIADYAQAIAHQDDALAAFYRKAIVRPAFLPVLDDWVAKIQAGQPVTNLLEDQQYLDQQLARFNQAEQIVEQKQAKSVEAGDNSDDFVLSTLLLASALFLAGVTTSFRSRGPRVFLLMTAFILMIYTGGRLLDIPVH